MPPRLDSPTASNTNAFDYRDDYSDSGEDPVSPPSPRSQGSRASSSSSASSTKSEIEFKAVPSSSTSAVEDLAVPGEFLEAHVVSNVCLGKSLSKEPQEDVYLEKAYSLFTKANELRLGNPNVTQTTVVQFISPLAMLNPANSKDTTMSAVLQNLQNKKVLDCTLKNVTVSDVKGADTNCLTKKTEITFLTPDNKTLSITLLEMAPDFRRQLLNKQTIAETVKHLEGHDPTCLLSFAGQGRSSIMASVLQLREAMKELKDGGGGALSQRQIVGLLDQKIEHIEQHRPKYLSLSQEVQLRQKDAIIEYLVDYAKELWPAPQAQQRPRQKSKNRVSFGSTTDIPSDGGVPAASHRAAPPASTTSAAPAPTTTVKGVELPNVGTSCYLNAAISTSHHLLNSEELVTSLTEASTKIKQQTDALYPQLIALAKQSPDAEKIEVTQPNHHLLRSVLKDVIKKLARDGKSLNDSVEEYRAARYLRTNYEKDNPNWRDDPEMAQRGEQLIAFENVYFIKAVDEINPEFEARFSNLGTALAKPQLNNQPEFWNRVVKVLERRKERELGRSALITTYTKVLAARQAYMETKTDGDQSKLINRLKECVKQFHTFSGGVGDPNRTQYSSSELLLTFLGFNRATSKYLQSCLCVVSTPGTEQTDRNRAANRTYVLQPPKLAPADSEGLSQVFVWNQSTSLVGDKISHQFKIEDLQRQLSIPEDRVNDQQLEGKTLMVALEYGTTDIEGRLATRIKFNPLKDNLQVPIQGIGNQVAVFEPVGVVVHSSNTARGGHYYSFINHGLANSPEWQNHNDDDVTTHTPNNKKWSEENSNARPTFMYYRFAGFTLVPPPVD